jgi:hypothetical protein
VSDRCAGIGGTCRLKRGHDGEHRWWTDPVAAMKAQVEATDAAVREAVGDALETVQHSVYPPGTPLEYLADHPRAVPCEHPMWAIRSRCRARFGFPGIRQRCGAAMDGAGYYGQCILVELHEGDHAFPARRSSPPRGYSATTQAGDLIEAGARGCDVALRVRAPSSGDPALLTSSEARLLAHALNVYADEVDTAAENRRRSN